MNTETNPTEHLHKGQAPFGHRIQAALALFGRRVLQAVASPMWYGNGCLTPRMLDESYVNVRSCWGSGTDEWPMAWEADLEGRISDLAHVGMTPKAYHQPPEFLDPDVSREVFRPTPHSRSHASAD